MPVGMACRRKKWKKKLKCQVFFSSAINFFTSEDLADQTIHWKQICAIMLDQGWSTLIISWSCLINPLVVTHPTIVKKLSPSFAADKNYQLGSIMIKYDQPRSIIIAQMCFQCTDDGLYRKEIREMMPFCGNPTISPNMQSKKSTTPIL